MFEQAQVELIEVLLYEHQCQIEMTLKWKFIIFLIESLSSLTWSKVIQVSSFVSFEGAKGWLFADENIFVPLWFILDFVSNVVENCFFRDLILARFCHFSELGFNH